MTKDIKDLRELPMPDKKSYSDNHLHNNELTSDISIELPSLSLKEILLQKENSSDSHNKHERFVSQMPSM